MILLMISTHWSVQAQSSCDMCTSAYTHLGADGFNTFFIITIIGIVIIIGSVMTILTIRPWNVVRCIRLHCCLNFLREEWKKSKQNLEADWKLRLHIIQSQNPEEWRCLTHLCFLFLTWVHIQPPIEGFEGPQCRAFKMRISQMAVQLGQMQQSL